MIVKGYSGIDEDLEISELRRGENESGSLIRTDEISRMSRTLILIREFTVGMTRQ